MSKTKPVSKDLLHPKRFSKVDLVFFSVMFALIGGFIVWKSFAASNTVIPTYDYVAQPYTDDSNGQCHQAIWAIGKSPTTPYISPDSYHHAQRYILANPNATDSAGNRGSDEWWFMFNQYFDNSYATARPGYSNSFFNLHNTAGDNGPGAGIGWGFGDGVSAVHLMNDGPNGSLMLLQSDNSRHVPLPSPSLNQWHSYVVHLVFGRNDGTTPRAGLAEVWMDGNKVATVNNTNTLQRAQGPDGNWYTQQWLQLWQGTYTQGAPCRPGNNTPVTGKLTLARIGKTSTEAINDVPQYDGKLAATHISGQPNYGDSDLSLSSSQLTVGNFILPSALGGSSSPPPAAPAPTPPPTPTPQPTPSPTPQPSTPAATVTSNIKNGDIVSNGTTWSATLSPAPTSVEFWANGTRLATDTTSPYSTVVNLPIGANQLGLCYTINLVRTCAGTGGIFATITVTAATPTPTPAPPTPAPTPVPPAPTNTTVSSSINNGATVANGTTWSATFGITPSSVEFWANGTRLATDNTSPFSTVLNLPVGKNQLGLCYTLNSVRTCGGTGGIFATVSVVAAATPAPQITIDNTAPSVPSSFKVTSATKYAVTLAWSKSTDNVGVAGYKLTRSLEQIYNGQKLSVTNYDLTPNSEYVYYLKSYDAAGNTSASTKKICVGKWNWWSKVSRNRSWKYC